MFVMFKKEAKEVAHSLVQHGFAAAALQGDMSQVIGTQDRILNLSLETVWVVDSQFARIRKLNGFARIRPGYARLLDIVRIALLSTASPAARIRNSH